MDMDRVCCTIQFSWDKLRWDEMRLVSYVIWTFLYISVQYYMKPADVGLLVLRNYVQIKWHRKFVFVLIFATVSIELFYGAKSKQSQPTKRCGDLTRVSVIPVRRFLAAAYILILIVHIQVISNPTWYIALCCGAACHTAVQHHTPRGVWMPEPAVCLTSNDLFYIIGSQSEKVATTDDSAVTHAYSGSLGLCLQWDTRAKPMEGVLQGGATKAPIINNF